MGIKAPLLCTWDAELPGLAREVHPGSPEALSSPLVWSGGALTGNADVHFYLNEEQQSEIANALRQFKVRSCAKRGGNSILASSWTVYNELARTQPDLIHTHSPAQTRHFDT
ncbi:hypothetical protein B0H67DRAFT_640551 [Lasiosphaeris hirsuta]|uniref:Uncharacterized protein n=1 Tax=Lasiosphaeris hirsuta TaxID=260670 RepID=A0AA40EEE6_9PEZI|nr:hypothetical protein B0H67DRAFT_640551 [Lasiosphaeris hirsuta]